MRTADIIKQAATKAGLGTMDGISTNLHTWALGALNRHYEQIWRVYPFREQKIVSLDVTATAGSPYLVLPQQVEALRALRSATDPLIVMSELFLNRVDPAAFTKTGTPVNYWNMPDSPVLTQPAAAGTITVVSSSTADTTQTVTLFGLVSGLTAREELSLNGTTPVTGSLSFSELVSVSKTQTTGRVTVKRGADTLGTVAPWDWRAAYRRVRLFPIPDASATMTVEGTRRFQPLVDDDETPMLPKCIEPLFCLLVADLHEFQGNYEPAGVERSKAEAALQIVLKHEQAVDDEDFRTYPAFGMFSDGGWPVSDTSKTGIYSLT